MAAAAAALSPAAAGASRSEAGSPLAAYVRARTADVLGQADAAAADYAALAAERPEDTRLAARAYRQAMLAGDRKRALVAARSLDAHGALPPDARLLLVGEAAAAKDWKAARAQIALVKHEDVFAFLVPALSAWVTLGAHDGDPLATLAAGGGGPLAGAYSGEQRALLALALGQADDGIAAIHALGNPTNARGLRLRIATAARLAALHHADQAQAMLSGDDPAIVAARALLAQGRPIPGAIVTATDGIAELLVRVAADLNRERTGPLALSLARTATFLAPGNSETWLVTSSILIAGESDKQALAALDQIAADDPLVGAARDLRVQLLLRDGDKEEALKEAIAATAGPNATAADWSRAGDIYAALDRYRQAADCYARALDRADGAGGKAAWALWLQRGSALERAGDWAAAKPALQKAVALAPDEAVALNYLGYAQLDRHENVAAATKLVERASTLKPDDPAITDSLGWAYYLQGNLAKAVPTLERAAAAAPAESDINEHLGDAYWAVGRRYEARYAWRAALVAADDKDAPRIRAKIDVGPKAGQTARP